MLTKVHSYISCENYEKLLQGNITRTYKRALKDTKRDFDRKTQSFAKTLKFEDKMDCYTDQHIYITLKGHKEFNTE